MSIIRPQNRYASQRKKRFKLAQKPSGFRLAGGGGGDGGGGGGGVGGGGGGGGGSGGS